MLIEMLQPAGPELARRWLAALLLADPEEREAIVSAVERRMAELYESRERAPAVRAPAAAPAAAQGPRTFDVVLPPVQREGYVEQVRATYEVVVPKPGATAARSPKKQTGTGRRAAR